MKKFTGAIIAVALILVVLGGYFILKNNGVFDGATQTEPTTEPTQVYTENPFTIPSGKTAHQDAKMLSFSFGGVTNSVQYKYGKWILSDNEAIDLVQKNVLGKLKGVDNCKGKIIIEDEVTEDVLESYGITEDSGYFTVKFEDTELTLRVGKTNQNGSSYYVWLEGSRKIHLVSNTMLSSIAFEMADLYTVSLFNFNDAGQITKVVIRKNGNVLADLRGKLSIQVGESRTWTMKSPLERAGNDTNIEALLTTVLSLSVSNIAELGTTDYAQYGLDNPMYSISLSDSNGTQSISIGNLSNEKNGYFISNGDGNVYIIDENDVNFTDETALAYMNKDVKLIYYANLTHVTVKINGKTYELGYEVDDDSEAFTFNGTRIEDYDQCYDFKRIGTALYCLCISALEDEPEVKGETVLEVVYTEKDGTVTKVTATKRDNATTYYYINDKYIGGYGNMFLITESYENYGILGVITHVEEMLKQ